MQSERISNKGGSVDTDVNPEGISKDLEAISLASAIAAGPVFVKFYAPWSVERFSLLAVCWWNYIADDVLGCQFLGVDSEYLVSHVVEIRATNLPIVPQLQEARSK